ncbi:hypothetical protein LJR074_003189 [Acidovorax sp. LjRoot74]|uniref:hypothetical protein n=1 Tax=Acidovorax sp. LjRoot74 TaxID=3342337 RepID=UPI003ED031C4
MELKPFTGELDAPSPSPAAAPAPPGLTPFTGQLDPAPAPAPAAPQRTAAESAARGFGIGTRGLVQGLVDLPATVTDNLVAKPVNAVLDAVRGKDNGPRMQMLGEATGNLLTKAGLPVAETASERVVQDINRGGGSAVSGIGLGGVLARGAGAAAQSAQAAGRVLPPPPSTVTEAVGRSLAAAPLTQVVSGAAGQGAAALTREGGGGEGAQLAANVAGSLAPSVLPFAAQSAVRGALRGGEAGRQRVAENIKTFEAASGTVPTMGQATQSRTLQAAETGLSNVIGGSGIMARRGEAQAKALEDSVQRLSQELAPDATGWGAGEAITKGVSAFKDSVKTTQKQLYGKLDEFIPSNTPVSVSRTQEALKALNEGIDGAPNLSQFFRNAKIGSIERAMLKDVEGATLANIAPGMSSTGVAPTAGQLPYQAIQKLRTLVGQEISENSLTSDVPRSKWRALYAALSDDLGTAAEQAGPQAQQAWSRANQYTKASMQRLDQLESIVNREAPERVFKAATSGLADGGTQITRLMKSMPDENRREVAAAVLQRLGRAKNSVQNEMGDAFSSETFLTNLAAMSLPARRALFSNSGFPGLEEKVMTMGRMAANRREGAQVFSNPSGTARQTNLTAWGSGLAAALATGSPHGITLALGIPTASAIGAKILTSPSTVRFAAGKTALDQSAAPAPLAAAARQSSEDEKARNRERLREARLRNAARPQ